MDKIELGAHAKMIISNKAYDLIFEKVREKSKFPFPAEVPWSYPPDAHNRRTNNNKIIIDNRIVLLFITFYRLIILIWFSVLIKLCNPNLFVANYIINNIPKSQEI